MSLPAWPDGVPYAVTSEWTMTALFVAPVATDMDAGNQRLRSKPGGNVALVNYPLNPLTAAQWATLNTFFRSTLGNGAARFTMPVFTGAAYESKTVQFDGGKSPSVTRAGALIFVVMTLRVFGM